MSLNRYARRIDQEATDEVWVKRNSGSDLVQVWNAYLFERIIRLPKGALDMNIQNLQIPTASEAGDIIMRGKGYFATTIKGSATKILDYLGTSTNPNLRVYFEDLGIEHNCQNPTDITLDADYLNTLNMSHVKLKNTNATKQGTAIHCLPHTIGLNPVWEQVLAILYGTGFDIGYDHLLAKNCATSNTINSVYVHDAAGIYHVTFDHFHAYQAGLTEAGITFRFLNTYGCEVKNPTVEGGSNAAGVMFQHDGGGNQVYVSNLKNIGSSWTVMSASNRRNFYYVGENVKHWLFPFTVAAGQTNAFIARIPALINMEELIFVRRIACYITAPGVGKNVTCKAYDGGNELRVTVTDTNAENYSRCEDDQSAMLTADAASGQPTIKVSDADAALFADGDTVTLSDATPQQETKTILSIIKNGATTDITFTANLTNAYTVAKNAQILRTASAFTWTQGVSATGYLLIRYTSDAGCGTGAGMVVVTYSELQRYS
jgi:hypothetical protein